MTDLHDPLRWVVLETPAIGPTRWSSMAAYRSRSAALSYARDCTDATDGAYIYRVVEHPPVQRRPVRVVETFRRTGS